MKKLAAAIALFASLVVLSAPGDRKYTITLAWDPYDWHGYTTNCGFILYEQVATNWVSVTNAPFSATSLVLNGVSPGIHTYALTASNLWAESDLSNTASTPRLPGPPVKVTVSP